MTDQPTAAFTLLRLTTRLVDAVQDGVRAAGFEGLRPAHGFAFTYLAAGPCSTVDLAAWLGMTKQSASKLVEQLVEHGYAERVADGSDGRVRQIVLTERGWAATRAADAAAAQQLRDWQQVLGPEAYANWARALADLDDGGPIRPQL